LDDVEPFLYARAERKPEQAPLALEALAEGYLRCYRVPDAVACVNHWLQFQPDNVRALTLRGDAWVRGRSRRNAIADYARAVELDPEQDAVRWRLVHCLLDSARYGDAQDHLEVLLGRRPDDPEAVARLARCRYMLGRAKEAAELLDAALAAHPGNGALLRTKGQIELLNGRPAEAESLLRRATAAVPGDHSAHFAPADALRRPGGG